MAQPREIQVDGYLRDAFLRKRVHIVRRSEWECWLWRDRPDNKGYGSFSFRQRRYKSHRLSYEIFIGPIPPGLVIDHLCKTRNCVNPEHMEPVTNAENVLRGESISSIQARKTHCVHGHPLSGNNLILEISRRGPKEKTHRRCKTCVRQGDQRVREREKTAKQAAEAYALLLSFAAWLAARNKAVTFGAGHDGTIAYELAKEFCDVNGPKDQGPRSN